MNKNIKHFNLLVKLELQKYKSIEKTVWTTERAKKYSKRKNYKKLNKKDKNGKTALIYISNLLSSIKEYASIEKDNELEHILKDILNIDNIDINAVNRTGQTAFDLIAHYQPDISIIEDFLNYPEIDINYMSDYGYDNFFFRSVKYQHNNLAFDRIMKETKLDINKKNIVGDNILGSALSYKNDHAVQKLLKNKNINISNVNLLEQNLLFIACSCFPEYIKNFINRKDIDVNLMSGNFNPQNNQSSLHVLCEKNPDYISYLFEDKNLDVNIINGKGQTALMYACVHNIELAFDLLQHPNIDVNIQSNQEYTALMYACLYNPNRVFELLQHPNIDIDLRSNANKKTLDVVKKMRNGSYEILLAYIEKKEINSNIHSKSKKRQTSL